MCSELGMEIKKSSNSKKSQFKELERYCTYSKTGHQITIIEVFEEQKPKVDNRKNNNSIYRELVEFLISDYLAQCEGSLCISRSLLMQNIGMINSNYGFCSVNVEKLSSFLSELEDRTIEKQLVYDFYNTNYGSFKWILESSLDSLMDKRVLRYSVVRKVSLSNETFNRIAEPDEDYIIDTCEKEVLKELGYDSISSVRNSKDWLKFKSKVKKDLKTDTNIEYYYNAYNIRINEKYIEEERDKLFELLLEESRREQLKNELNDTIIKRIIEKAESRHNKENTKGTWGASRNKKDDMRRKDTYITDFQLLSKWLINIETESIRDKVAKTKLEILPQDLIDDIEEMMEMFG